MVPLPVKVPELSAVTAPNIFAGAKGALAAGER